MNAADRKKILIRNGSMAVIFLAIAAFLAIKSMPIMGDAIHNSDRFREYVLSYGDFGVIVFMALQILHILVPLIPGEFVQIAGGYIYGTFWGSTYLIIGTVLGEWAIFCIARWIGYPLVQVYVKPHTLEKIKGILDSNKADYALFMMMLIPGIPKDTLVYVGGLTPMSCTRFLIVSMAARIPCLVGSAYMGANILHRDYTMLGVMIGIILVMIAIGYLIRDTYLPSRGSTAIPENEPAE